MGAFLRARNEIIARRMNKKQQMRWNRSTAQSFLDVRAAVLNENLEDAFRHRYPGFRPTSGGINNPALTNRCRRGVHSIDLDHGPFSFRMAVPAAALRDVSASEAFAATRLRSAKDGV
jgi:hypothetical protein